MEHDQKGKLKNLPGILAEFNGKQVIATAVKGKSGETTLVNLDNGRGLFVTDAQFEAAD